MRNPDSLIKLIKSLNRSEKANLRTYLNSEKNNYVHLYKLIEREIEFSNLRDEQIMNRLNYANTNSYYVAKNYLYELILRSLCELHYDSGSDDSLRSRILCVKILYEKTLFSKAYELLKKIKKSALESENFIRLIEIIKWEKNLAIEGVIKGKKSEIISKLIAEEEHTLKCISNISNYRLLSFQFGSFIKEAQAISGKERSVLIKGFINNPLLRNEKNAITLASKLTYYEIIASLNNLLSNLKPVYEARKKMIALIDANPVFKKENLTNFVISLYNYTGTCIELGYLIEAGSSIARLRDTAGIYENVLAANTSMLINIGAYYHEVRVNLKSGKYEEAAKNGLLLAETISKYDNVITENEKARSLIYSVIGLFINHDYNNALKMINIILGYNSENIEPETLALARLIQVMTMYETGSYESVDYNAIALERYLSKGGSEKKMIKKEIKLIKEFLNILRKIPGMAMLVEQTKELQKKNQIIPESLATEFIFTYWLNTRK